MLKTYIIEDAIYRTCVECNREFDLLNEIDREEYFYGHDCDELYTDYEEVE